MLITHDIRPQGHYVTTHQDNITLTIRTEHGTASEMAAEAADMRKKANRLTRNANLIRDAIYSDQWEHRTPAGRHTGDTYPATTTGVKHVLSGLSFAHKDAPQDANFKALQEFRYSAPFVILSNSLLEI